MSVTKKSDLYYAYLKGFRCGVQNSEIELQSKAGCNDAFHRGMRDGVASLHQAQQYAQAVYGYEVTRPVFVIAPDVQVEEDDDGF